MRKFRNLAIIFLIIVGGSAIVLASLYNYNISPISNKDEKVIIDIKAGSSVKDIAKLLEDKGLIRNKTYFLVYTKIFKINNLKASTYELNKNMGVEKIIDILVEGNSYNPNVITITFKEGINYREIANLISENTNNTYNDTIAVVSDKEYIKELIDNYWFLTDEILNDNIYYPLEGYLYPDTYQFADKNVTVNEILKKMLDQMDKVLTSEKEKIEKSNLTIHELITLASIVELEGVGNDDRDKIAEVFYNRLNAGWSLGSDVTACYAFKVEIADCNDNVDYSVYNPYNTRSTAMAGKLPVGPICSPSKNSIFGSIEPDNHDYYYFVADKYKQVYFTKTLMEHQSIIQEIKNKGDWPW